MNTKALKWINTIAFAVMIIVNAMANLLPLGGNTTGQVSENYPNLFTPAPITFAIWGVIYLLMGAFVLYQWGIFDSDTHSKDVRDKVGLWFAISSAFNVAWIFFWHFEVIGISVLMIAGLLFSLIMIGRRLKNADNNMLYRFMVKPGFDIYFGWIIAATIANISVFLVQIGWNGFGIPESFWTVAILLVGAAIGALTVLVERRWFSALTIVWAYIGILIKHISTSGYSGEYVSIIAAAIIGIVLMLSVIFIKAVLPKLRDERIKIGKFGKQKEKIPA